MSNDDWEDVLTVLILLSDEFGEYDGFQPQKTTYVTTFCLPFKRKTVQQTLPTEEVLIPETE